MVHQYEPDGVGHEDEMECEELKARVVILEHGPYEMGLKELKEREVHVGCVHCDVES